MNTNKLLCPAQTGIVNDAVEHYSRASRYTNIQTTVSAAADDKLAKRS